MSRKLGAGVLAILIAASAGQALAHGGRYQGPPSGGGGGPGGGSTPGFGGGGATGPLGRPKTSTRYRDWDWWWDLNEERFLQLKQKVRSAAGASDNRDTFLGEDLEEDVEEITLRNIRQSILPTLLLALKDPWYDARAGALIALGKVAGEAEDDVRGAIGELLADPHHSVRESACLALGLLGDAASVPLLFDIVANEPAARRRLGREQKDILTRTRAFAAVAVGLAGVRQDLDAVLVDGGRRTAVEQLVRLARTESRVRDLQVGPALALGVARTQSAVPAMLEMLRDRKMDQRVRAHVAVALGKVGAKAAIPDLTRALHHPQTHIARSAAIALGMLASPEDDVVAKELIKQAASASDRALRNFAIMALGEQGSTRGRGFLLDLVSTAKNFQDESFAAVALGVAGFGSEGSDSDAGELCLARYEASRSDSMKAAYAVALGLLDHQPAVSSLRRDLERGGSQDLKGHVCTALGLLGDRASIPEIEKLVRQRGDIALRKRAAIALGLLGDPAAVKLLEEVIEESGSSKAVLGAATVALGYIGDRRAVPILQAMVEDPEREYQDSTRAFATVSLGFLGDKDDLPLLSRVQENSNYLAMTAALAEILTLL